MDSDLLLILGAIIAVLSIPAVIAAFSESRPPRSAAILAVLGGALIVTATYMHPGGYRLNELPDVAVRVMDRYVR